MLKEEYFSQQDHKGKCIKQVCSCILRIFVCMLSHSDMSNSLQPYGLQPARLLCPWKLPGKNIGVIFYFLLLGSFLGGNKYGGRHGQWHWLRPDCVAS